MRNFKNFFLKLLIILFFLIIYIFISAKTYSITMFQNISDDFLRLHVVANSDATDDQILKYYVRDAVIEYMKPYFSNITNKQDALEILKSQETNINNLATQTINNNGYNYSVKVSIGNFYFPTKEYSKITLPEGYYDSLKIEIGKAEGQNWWCVMFPSLCIIDNSCNFSEISENILRESLSDEEYSIINQENSTTDIKIKFKLIELFENI